MTGAESMNEVTSIVQCLICGLTEYSTMKIKVISIMAKGKKMAVTPFGTVVK